MTFDEAVAAPGGRVQAWDLTVRQGKRTVSIYAVGVAGAQQLACKDVPHASYEATAQDLERRGLARAEGDFFCDFVWLAREDGLIVYDRTRCVLEARGDQLRLADGARLPKSSLAKIVAFAASDYIERGVRAQLRSGETRGLVIELALGPMGDPTYSRNELLFETEWATRIANALAAWAGVRYEDLI